jgi:demethylmenaquinone methyltransferase/2-methoxy-6-polyprenyl-1,4-benzoquinol methylase
MNERKALDAQDPQAIRAMFDAIAPRYDLLNRLLSLGLHRGWRKRAVSFLAEKRGGLMLDIAAGSGDVSLELLSLEPSRVVATDFAPAMLEVLRHKLNGHSGHSRIEVVICDALHLPFQDRLFDGAIVAFGIRNFADRDAALREMFRVLAPDGISVILEFSKPDRGVVGLVNGLYMNLGVPLLGRIISGHKTAYRYLPRSISAFPERVEFLSSMKAAGFTSVEAHSLTMGVATIYVGRRPKH